MNMEIEKKIDDLLSKMTVKEKVGQLTQYSTNPKNEEMIRKMLKNGELGGFLCGTGGFGTDEEAMEKNREYVNSLQRIAVEESRMGIPAIFGKDVIHGHNTVFPIPLAMTASFNPELVEECYDLTAKEAANDGIMWSFAPMVDLSHDPRWGRCVEGIGEDPYLGEQMAAAMVRGFQGRDIEDLPKHGNIAACAKHYICYGAAEGGRDYQKAEVSDYTLRNYYLPSFRGAVKAGARTVMSSFNEVSGQPTTSSHYLLTELLKEELGFDGFIVSDDYSISQLKRQGVAADDGDCARLALNAGLDMDMDDMIYHNNLEDQVNRGLVSMESLDEAVRRVLRVKFQLGLFEDPYAKKVPVDFAHNMAVARKMAGESMVLLKNNDNLLPLAKGTNFVTIGSFYTEKQTVIGAWACDYVFDWVKSFEDGVKDVSPESNVWSWNTPYSIINAYPAKHNDIIVVAIGDHGLLTGEASGIASIELPDDQKLAIANARKFGKKVIGVLFFGRPVAIEDVEPYFDAIIYAWNCGTESGTAVADILFGDVNPSGKLPMTLPRVTGQIPIYYNSPQSCRPIDEYYGREAHLENYRDEYGTPMYPFGYGLSYTEFEYSSPSAAKASLTFDEVKNGARFEISVRVKNTGDRAGKEIVQCYVRDTLASMTRPIRELKGFEKPMLQPGEEKTVTFSLGWDELAFYHADKTFAPEPGKFIIYTGGDCYAKDSVEIEII